MLHRPFKAELDFQSIKDNAIFDKGPAEKWKMKIEWNQLRDTA